MQAWLADEDREGRLVILTRGAIGLGAGVVDLVGAAVRGLVRSAQSEHPGRVMLVDVEPGLERVAEQVRAAVAVAGDEPDIAVRGDGGVAGSAFGPG